MLKNVDYRHYAALRFVMGIFLLLVLLQLFPEAEFNYSDAGWYPLSESFAANSRLQWSVFYIITTPWAVNLYFLFSIMAAIFMIVGYHTRLSTFAVFVCFVSVITRNHYNISGQDKLLRIVAFYLCLAPCGKAWSVDSLLARWRQNRENLTVENFSSRVDEKLKTEPCPSWPLVLIQFQICITYLATGLDKSHGAEWVNGSALLTALVSHTFGRFDVSWMSHYPFLVEMAKTLTQATYIWELAFAFLMLTRWTRWIGLAIGMAVHGGITVLMQVNLLGYLMIASYAALLPADTFRRVADWLERKIKFTGTKSMVIFDGYDEPSFATALLAAMMDFTGRVAWVPFQKTKIWKTRLAANQAPASADFTEFRFVSGDGQVFNGVQAWERLFEALPVFLPIKLLFLIPGFRKLGLWMATHGRETKEIIDGALRDSDG